MWPLAKILDYDKNPRTHPPEQIARLAASMLSEGVTMPILVDEAGVIIAGHGRKAAALVNSFTEYPVVIARGWSEQKKRAARISDNSLGLMSGWDSVLITGELQNLKLAGYDLPLLGFPEAQLRGWGISLGTDSAQDPEAVPERPKKPVVRKGDLWVLGDHRLLCGDATSESDVAMCLGNEQPKLMVVDPPYGVDYRPVWRNGLAKDARGKTVLASSDASAKPIKAFALGEVLNDDKSDWSDAVALFHGDVVYIWHADKGGVGVGVGVGLMALDFELRAQIIWKKSHSILSRGHYNYGHEPCWYAVRNGKTGHWTGRNDQSTVWEISHHKSDTGHGTQKPIECMKRPIENNSRVGEYVYDPFVGSGTTCIAAEMTGRKALMIEIDPGYCEVVIRRWESFVGNGKRATLDGKTLDQVAAARRKRKANGSKRKHPPLRANRKGDGLRDAGVDAAADAE